MRRFSFHAKNIGSERYLTYIMGEGSELDEETLDFMEEENIRELVGVIFEQDDDYDYLTYDVSGKTALEKFTNGVVEKEVVLKVLRNIALGLISCKDHGLHLSYILLHKNFIYIDKETLRMQFICLPVESEASVATEFKGFVRQLIANFKYDINGDLSYVGTLLAFINGDSFNLRNLVGLTEALMEDDGIDFEEEEGISTEDGEVISGGSAAEHEMPEEKDISSFMMDLGDGNEALPEIGDDEEEEAEAETAQAAEEEAVETTAEETAEAVEETEVEETEVEDTSVEETAVENTAVETDETSEETAEEAAETEEAAEETAEENAEETDEEAEDKEAEESSEPSLEELEAKAKELAEVAKQATRGTRSNAKVKVSRAALIQKAAHEAEVVEETGELGTTEMLAREVNEVSRVSKNAKEKKNVVTEDINMLNPTDLVAAEGETAPEEKKTGVAAIKVNPYLIRETTEERTMITKNVFKIGKANRGVDYRVSGNGAISRQHAIITRKDDGFYIRDNKSTNHTYVNGKELADGEEVLLKNNSKITLGDEEFIFKF